MIFLNVKDLRKPGYATCVIPKNKPGVYKWWAKEDVFKCLLENMKVNFSDVKDYITKEDDYYCIYIGVAIRESLYNRIVSWHINQKNTLSAVKSGTLSTLRQSIAGVLGVSMTDTDSVNNFMDSLYVTYESFDLPIKSKDAKNEIGSYEKACLSSASGVLYILNILGNKHSCAPLKELKALRKEAKNKALNI